MPYSSWHILHRRRDVSTQHRFACPACRQPRSYPSPHRQKLFLVAERLSWEEGAVPTTERELNQELTWEVNFQLGIEDPVVEDLEQIPGGKNSKSNQWHPFANDVDYAAAMKLSARADGLTDTSYSLWSKMPDTLHSDLPTTGADESSRSETRRKSAQLVPGGVDKAVDSHLPTPPSSSQPFASQMLQGPRPTEPSQPVPLDHTPPTPATSDYTPSTFARSPFQRSARPAQRSLAQFYSLLDATERISYVGAKYFGAYAEHLRDDLYDNCWWMHNLASDDALPD